MKSETKIWLLALVTAALVAGGTGCGGQVVRAQQGTGTPVPTIAPTESPTPPVMMVQMVPVVSSTPSKGVALLCVVIGGTLIMWALLAAKSFLNVRKTATTRRRVGLVVIIECLGLIGCYLLVQPVEKTLWDWLDLLIVPIVLALGGLWFSQQERRTEYEITQNRARIEREIAADRLQEDALQMYLDKMTELLLEKDLRTSDKVEVKHIARTRTLTVLHRLNQKRKGMVVQFLHESDLMTGKEAVINLDRANLGGAYLIGTNLREAILIGAILSGANLRKADLSGSDLTGAYLIGTDLSGANLSRTILIGVNLSRANLVEANLHEANLEMADLTNARVTNTQLSQAYSLTDATLPNSARHTGPPSTLVGD